MNAHQGPLSPVSIASSEWSGVTRYQSNDHTYSPTLDSNNSRGNLITPPVSGFSHGVNGNLHNGMNGRSTDYRSNPSPPSSIARSSNGTTMSLETQRRKQSMMEDNLAQHYTELKAFLASTLRDDRNGVKPNRARDKLLRLSAVQFQELSTDVYDELLRRKDYDDAPPGEREKRPAFLLPKENFHPKRNQARQKLSTLPITRFTALATDVFFELERRFPRFAAGDISRRDSPANSMRGPPSRTGTPDGTRPGSKGQGQGPKRPGYTRQGSLGGQVFAGHGIPAMGGQDDFNRPAPKSSQTNTIVPNKSYLVEDDDDPEYVDDMYSVTRRDTSMTSRSTASVERDKKMIADYQTQINDLQGRIGSLEDQARVKDATIASLEGSKHEMESASREFEQAGQEWSQLQRDLEGKLEEALKLNDNLQSEIDKVRSYHANELDDLRSSHANETDSLQSYHARELDNLQSDHASELDNLRSQLEQKNKQITTQGSGNNEWKARYEELQRDNEELRRELQEQQKISNEVRLEASTFLSEMKAISDRSGQNWEREEKLSHEVHRLEDEVKEWKSRYARTKTQLRTVRTASMGLAIQSPGAIQTAKDGSLTRQDGLVRDVHVTKFQIAIDEVLRIARVGEGPSVIEYMKAVVLAIRAICQDISDSVAPDDDLAQQRARLRANVSATANNFITAAKNFAQAHGLSPVSLLDAAASHLAAAVVELVRTVKIRPTPAGELGDDDDGSLPPGSTGYFSIPASTNGRASVADSVYSSHASVQQISPPQLPRAAAHIPRNPSRDHTARQGLPNGNAAVVPRPGHGPPARDSAIEDLKLFLDTQTLNLVSAIQSLVSSIRTTDPPPTIHTHILAIAAAVKALIHETTRVVDGGAHEPLREAVGPVVRSLAACKARLLAADDDGREVVGLALWREHLAALPPLAFELARGAKELVGRVEGVGSAGVRAGEGDEWRL
ncbi:component of the polarisome [Xylographa opegraphella]|nr:component of the polarisome [Xylographa opegraphella]